MKIIKEVVVGKETISNGVSYKRRTKCIVRSNTYSSTYDYFNKLVSEARISYPQLTDEEIRIVHYGGDYYAKTFGIEFSLDTDDVLDGWKEIDKAEILL